MEENEKKYQAAQPDTIQKRALRIIKGTATFEDRFLPEHTELIQLIKVLRSMGCIIVFTTGVWDIWHMGHGKYLKKGKEEGAKLYPEAEHVILVVGVETDKLTRERKGPGRPIVPENERCEVMDLVRPVDIVTLQYEADQLFKVVDHDVRVISSSTADLPEMAIIKEQCAHVVNLPPQAETSTTAMIRKVSIDGAMQLLIKIKNGLATLLKEVEDGIEKK